MLTGGTDVHLVLVDLRDSPLDGQQAEDLLHEVGITVNRNAVPFDPRPPMVTSGCASAPRVGHPWIRRRAVRRGRRHHRDRAGRGTSADVSALRARVSTLAGLPALRRPRAVGTHEPGLRPGILLGCEHSGHRRTRHRTGEGPSRTLGGAPTRYRHVAAHDWVPWDAGRNFAFLGGEDWDPSDSTMSDEAKAALMALLLLKDNLPSYHRVLAMFFPRSPTGAPSSAPGPLRTTGTRSSCATTWW